MKTQIDSSSAASCVRKGAAGLICSAAIITVAACASSGPPVSAAYREGYRYGCYNGYDASGYNWYWGLAQNKPQYAGSPEWETAWQRGYRDCFNRGLVGEPFPRGYPPGVIPLP